MTTHANPQYQCDERKEYRIPVACGYRFLGCFYLFGNVYPPNHE
ncbi:hypothetical protein [Haladaptatus sp. DFWS20]